MNKNLLNTDKILSLLIIILFGFFRPGLLLIAVYVLLFPYLILTKRTIAIQHLLLSSVVAIIWMGIANNQYNYQEKMFVFFGINSYPLFGWAVGLFVAYIIYSHWEIKLKNPSQMKRLLFFSALYIPTLILVETLFYHGFGIQNAATAIHVGLPICQCIHAPIWMQAAYILMGPIYFALCLLLRLENPHKKHH